MQILIFYLAIRFLKGIKMWIPVVLFPGEPFNRKFFVDISDIIDSLFSDLPRKGSLIKLVVLYLLGVVFFFVAQEFLFFHTIKTLLQFPFPLQNIGGQKLLFFPVVAFISFLPLIFRFHPKSFDKMKVGNFQLLQTAPFLVIVVLAVLSVYQIDKKNIHYFQAEKLFYEQKFNQLIAYNTQFPSMNILQTF